MNLKVNFHFILTAKDTDNIQSEVGSSIRNSRILLHMTAKCDFIGKLQKQIILIYKYVYF